MADENKPAFYPRVGNIKAKNFKPAQPMPFVDDERAMDLPQYGDVDLSVPSKENLELSRRMAERDAQLRRQQQADRSPLEKLAGGLQAGRFLGSAMTQGINSIPTRLFKGDEAADKFMEERIYKPEQPVAYEYAQDVGDFLDRLETEYKIPPLMPEALPLQHLSSPATSQAMRTAGRGAEQVGRKLESAMEPVVKGAFERGGLPREMVMAMGANTQSNVVKPYGGNWLGGADQLSIPENDLRRLKGKVGYSLEPEAQLKKLTEKYTPEALARLTPDIRVGVERAINETRDAVAVNRWIDSNLTNYVKKEMGTPDDPVRRLAEEGIVHTPLRNDLDRMEYLQAIRKAEGYPAEGMGKSDLAKQWENITDDSIRVTKAGKIQDAKNISERVEQARAEIDAYTKELDKNFLARMSDHTGNEIFTPKEAEMLMRMPEIQKAEILGDTRYKELKDNLYELLAREQGFEKRAGELNPFVAKLDPETRLYSGSTYELGFDHIIDVLKEDVASGRIRPEQLNKVSMEQAVRRTYEYDQELAKKMAETRLTARAELPVYKEYPEGLKWVELNRPGDFAAESDAMGHSVRGYEPPEGHPDWTKNSGDSGYSSYGHGGWDAIKRGDAKVYSLIDSKGEPHVTVEAHPSKYALRWDVVKEYMPAATEEAKKLPHGYTDRDISDIAMRMAKENEPFSISQIKGKQNAAPKADYLPFVQDFVRSGKWSNIGDLKNTDMIDMNSYNNLSNWLKSRGIETPRYVTKDEFGKYEGDYLLDELKPPPTEGMKRGGKVSISNNPDTMMLEVNNQKMKNGEPAYAGGKLIVGKGLKAAKPPKIEVPRLSMQFGNDLPINMNTAEVENLARRFPEPTVDRVNMAHKDVLKRTPELQEAAARIEAGDISADEYARLVQRYKPVTPYESVPAPASREEILAALSKTSREAEGLPRKETYFGKPSSTLKEGDPVGLRLDIPSYNQANTWVVTAHGPRKSPVSGGAGTRIGYEPVAMATDVDFSVSPKAALGIAKGAEKNTIATMEGKWKPTSSDEAFTLAKQYLKNPEWRQVGMDPERHSFFYDRETMAPVVNAEEVIQIGPLVLAKNPKFGKLEDFKYASGGLAHMKEGGSEDDAKPYFGGAGTKKYAAAKKRAEQADVNTLKDPRTYAAVAGLMGERPDEMGFSVLHPDYQAIKDVAEPAFGLGIAAQAYPMLGPLTKGLPVGASVKSVSPLESSGVFTSAMAKADAERALPLVLPRAMPKSLDEINSHAERVARQMMGEHVTSGKAGDTKNLAGRSMKESQRVKALDYELTPTKAVPESQVYQPQIGDINVALPGDFTLSDVELKSLMGEAIGSRQEGGSRYGLGHMKAKTPLFYASNEVPAQAVQNKATDLSNLFGSERIIGQHMAMGPIATNFAQHFADANLRYIDYSKLTPENMYMFDKLMAKGFEITKKNPKTGEIIVKVVDFPQWPGIANPQAAYKAMQKYPEMRKYFNKVMQTPSITEPLNLPNGLDVRYAITSPDLRDMEVNLTGHGVGQLVPNAPLTDTAKHKTYSKGIPGMYLGHQEVLTPFAISYPDAAQHIITHQRPQDFTGTIQKVFPHQRVDQQFMDEVGAYRRRIKELTGRKKGGAVKKEGGAIQKPAAKIDGNEFVLAAQKYGIKDSMNNLNKIVDLVNKGYTVDDAARQVADTGMHKAAGGAIRGDDLILEERPL